MGRVTITGMLISINKQFKDWTAAYQLFYATQMNTDRLFEVSSQVCLEQLTPNQMIVCHLDDTIIRKSGKKIQGTSWRRDPLGPAFCTNLVWAQRFIQISMSLYDSEQFNSSSKAIPIDFFHCPSVKKPSKKATDNEIDLFKEKQKIQNLSMQGAERIKLLRQRMNRQAGKDREIYLCVDGSYTNKTILKTLPKGITLIGRIRKDAHFNYLPTEQKKNGKKRIYGDLAPTPEEVRMGNDVEYQKVKGWAAGKVHDFKVKVVKNLKWRVAGGGQLLQMVLISPLGYRLKNGSKLLYRQPAYVICTDNELDIEKLLQAYLWRWQIEVNFREEKTTNGCGDAQVRNIHSSVKVPQFVVAVHSFMHLADHIATKQNINIALPKAKWEKRNEGKRASTNNMLNIFRGYYWLEKTGNSFYDFVTNQHKVSNSFNPIISAINPIFYQRK